MVLHVHKDSCGKISVSSESIPLYEGSQITDSEAVVALLSVASKHRLNYACILQLVTLLLPKPNGLSISLHQSLGKFVNFSKETTIHKFCGNCSTSIEDDKKCQPAAL